MIFMKGMPQEIARQLNRWGDLQPGQYHTWMLRLACLWIKYGQSTENTRHLMYELADTISHRRIEPRELDRIVDFAVAGVSDRMGRGTLLEGPHGDELAIETCKRKVADMEPIPGTRARGNVLDQLFAPDDLLACGEDPSRHVMLRAGEIHPEQFSFIVPNPMIGPGGRTKANVRRREYLIVEFDTHEPSLQITLLNYIRHYLAPLVTVVWSGNKSYHGWFRVSGLGTRYLETVLFQAMWSLGADMAMKSENQWCRMPNGIRSPRKAQPVIYLNPTA